MLAAAGWLWYVPRLNRGSYVLSDDLPVLQQAGSWGHMLKPYNGALSLVSMLVYRACAEVGHLSYAPFLIAGAVSFVAVPLSYFFTSRRQLGPPVAAILAMPLLWFNGTDFRPAALNHFLALFGGILCAAALNRGRRADGVLAGALLFSLCSAGGGLVVAGACLVHNVLVRPPVRRWLAVLVPSALYGLWWLLEAPAATTRQQVSVSTKVRIVRDLFFAPFRQVGFGSWPLAVVLLAAFLVWGIAQMRQGRVASANFVAWTLAMIGWPLALATSRGAGASSTEFRYAYLSLGFALLAVVPRRPIAWPDRFALTNRRWLAVAAVVVLILGGVRALDARSGLQKYASLFTVEGQSAKGTMLVLKLGPDVIPDSTPIIFYSRFNPHGTAKEARALMDLYGSPFHPSIATVDQDLVDLRAVQVRPSSRRDRPSCQPLTHSLTVAPTSFEEAGLGEPTSQLATVEAGPASYHLWSTKAFTIDVRRFGDHWVPLAKVPANRGVTLLLPILNSEEPWGIRANGACITP